VAAETLMYTPIYSRSTPARTCAWGVAIGVLVAVWLAAVSAQEGKPADGKRTIWDGVFTEGQATRGEQTYRQSCMACHKEDLLGDGSAPALAGAAFSARWVGSSVDDMVQIIRSSMPQDAPDSLGVPAYVDIAAYMIKVNGGPAATSELPTESAALKQIQVTNPR
jgi:S-disulfanyl-L-cysteine oxidoreductase SoxD